MRVLIAGATGAIGRPLIGLLRERGHSVFALARSPGSARMVTVLGGEALIADALDAVAAKAAIMQAPPGGRDQRADLAATTLHGADALSRKRSSNGSPDMGRLPAWISSPIAGTASRRRSSSMRSGFISGSH